MSTITTVTLAYNEEKNIGECLQSVKKIADRMVVLDGCSQDKTVEIARQYGAEVYQKDCRYDERFQFGMDTVDFDSDWIFFIDADERLTDISRKELKDLCDRYRESDVNGIVVNYRVEFMGRELKHGASALHKLRVFRPQTAFLEDIPLDQHIRLNCGKMITMKSFLLHKDYKGLVNWSQKHSQYADWASDDFFEKRERAGALEVSGLEKKAKFKRILKYNVYYKLPPGIRSWLFYIYRYYIRLGFLDDREGKIYTYLHAYWYRYLVDALIFEKSKGECR